MRKIIEAHMLKHTKKMMLSLTLAGLLTAGCEKWDDHTASTNESATKDLLTEIKENKDLSRFYELLGKSGYDAVLQSSKMYTVFAPTNTALASLDPAIENSAPKLRLFVANHIATQQYGTAASSSLLRIKMMSEKYSNMLGSQIGEAQITTANEYAKNGILHVINKSIPVRESAWEFVENNTEAPAKEKAYLLSLFRKVFDTSNAIQTGVDANTGLPIYQAGTDSITTNLFWRNVYDLQDESREYTFFMLTDDAWDAEVTKYSPYFKTGSADSTAAITQWTVVKDFAVEGVYDPATIPDTILSKFNTKMGISKSSIVKTIRTSNGIVYIMNKLSVRVQDKFKGYVIEGENFSYQSPVRSSNTYFRDRFNPLTGKYFRDVLVYGHGTALFTLGYSLPDVPTMKYKAYWVALHDNINSMTTTFTQKVGIGSYTSTLLPYVTVNLNDYTEVYLGDFTLDNYRPTLGVFLTAANSTTATANPVVCDYIRLEPVF